MISKSISGRAYEISEVSDPLAIPNVRSFETVFAANRVLANWPAVGHI